MFKKLIQVGFVTKNLKSTLSNLNNIYNISPWYVLKFSPDNVDKMYLHGKKSNYSMKIGVRSLGEIRIEYIEPIDHSIYSEFFDRYGDRIVHHLKFDIDDYRKTLDILKAKDIKILQSGQQLGDKGKNMYYYMGTEEKLTFISEIVNVTSNFIKPEPDYWYPEKNKERDFIFNGISQIGIVVNDIKKKIINFEEFGIGPWEIKEYGKKNISNMKVLGLTRDYKAKIAFSKLGNIVFKLIQPLSNSIFLNHLKKYGESIHHLKMEVDNYNEALDYLLSRGVKVIQSGSLDGKINFSYLDTGKHINFTTEISEKKINPDKKLLFHP